ncbi:MAG: hypothetical protein WB543_12645 [Candidatus Acidiferrum sp.]
MNRAFLIILIPAVLVAIGYIVVFHAVGVSPVYWPLILLFVLLGGAMWWLGRRTARKARSSAR